MVRKNNFVQKLRDIFLVNYTSTNPASQETSEGGLGRRMEPMFASDGQMLNPLMNRILDFNGGFSDEDFMEATIAEAEIDGR